MLLCDDTITLYQPSVDENTGLDVYNGHIITGVHWYSTTQVSVGDKGLQAANAYTIRIPVEADGAMCPNVGDIIINGTGDTEAITPSALKKKYKVIVTVVGVTDSAKAPNAPHWKVVGK